jgi:DNA-binding NarL/FixJ family response regulator
MTKGGEVMLPTGQQDPARVVICDDHELVRSGYQQMLSSEPAFEVVGEAENGLEALELCRSLKPDLVLMDAYMPVMDGLKAVKLIKQESPDTAVLIVSTYKDHAYMSEALRGGAAGYVLKDAPRSQLLNAANRALSGENPLNEELAAGLIRHLSTRLSEIESGSMALPEALTERERAVLRLLSQGQSNSDIAQSLTISKLTAKTHVQNIIRKLDVSDRVQAVFRATKLGLLDDE